MIHPNRKFFKLLLQSLKRTLQNSGKKVLEIVGITS